MLHFLMKPSSQILLHGNLEGSPDLMEAKPNLPKCPHCSLGRERSGRNLQHCTKKCIGILSSEMSFSQPIKLPVLRKLEFLNKAINNCTNRDPCCIIVCALILRATARINLLNEYIYSHCQLNVKDWPSTEIIFLKGLVDWAQRAPRKGLGIH